MVKNPPSNAGDVGSIPGRGTKFPHAAGQLSPCAAATEPTQSRAHVPQLESLHATTAEPAHSGAHAPQLESLCAAATEPAHSRARVLQRKISRATIMILHATTKTQHSQINQSIKKKLSKILAN